MPRIHDDPPVANPPHPRKSYTILYERKSYTILCEKSAPRLELATPSPAGGTFKVVANGE